MPALAEFTDERAPFLSSVPDHSAAPERLSPAFLSSLLVSLPAFMLSFAVACQPLASSLSTRAKVFFNSSSDLTSPLFTRFPSFANSSPAFFTLSLELAATFSESLFTLAAALSIDAAAFCMSPLTKDS
jgi:hypothetical protein